MKMNWSELNLKLLWIFISPLTKLRQFMQWVETQREKRCADGFSDDATGEFTVYFHDDKRIAIALSARGNRCDEKEQIWSELNNYQLM